MRSGDVEGAVAPPLRSELTGARPAAPAAEKTERTLLLSGPFVQPVVPGLSLLGATALLSTFTTASSSVMYPFAYGRLGSVIGPFMGLGLQALVCGLSILMVDVAVELKCSTFGDLGYAIGGKWGGRVLRGTQTLSNALFMPISIALATDALRQIGLNAAQCDTVFEPTPGSTCAWWDDTINSLIICSCVAWPVLLLLTDIVVLSWHVSAAHTLDNTR